MRGHQVTVYEKGNELGGQLNLASKIPGRIDFDQVTRYYTYQMELLGVKLVLGTVATNEMIKSENPDAVVIATGSAPVLPSIPGGDGENVADVRAVLQEKAPVGQKVVVIAEEHHEQALGVADFLFEKGKNVEVLTGCLYAGGELEPYTHSTIYARLVRKGVVITPLTKVKEIEKRAVVTTNTLSGEEKRIEDVDTIVFAATGRADDALYHELKEDVKEIHMVGHCLSPRKIQDSIRDGALVGRRV
ncbi:FAD-dependent oxidoreductase [Thermodesulfobacteriota bacterium]